MLGNSITANSIRLEECAVNLAVAEATIDWIAKQQLDIAAKLQPSRIILAAGVNDRSVGATPSETAAKLVELAEGGEAIGREVEVIVLAILPPARVGEFSGAASRSRVLRPIACCLSGQPFEASR